MVQRVKMANCRIAKDERQVLVVAVGRRNASLVFRLRLPICKQVRKAHVHCLLRDLLKRWLPLVMIDSQLQCDIGDDMTTRRTEAYRLSADVAAS